MRLSDPIVDIADQYQARFRETLGTVRRIGREAEFPLVWPDGRAGDASLLWAPLLEQGGLVPVREGRRLLIGARGPDVIYQAEVGKPTIELSLGPYDDLWELQRGLDQALRQLTRAAERCGLWVLGYGIQPRSPPSSLLLTPRPHYRAYHQALGKPWLRLTTTAADQVHVDISRSEVLDSVNWMNLLSGPIIALCANSSVYAGRQGRYLSGREGFLRELGIHRHGMTPVSFQSFETLIRYLADYPAYVLPQDNGFRRVDMTFLQFADRELSRDPEALFKAFLWHEHYVWNSARPRVAHSTIEVRPACQQPPSELMASSALILGLVEALTDVQAY
ncbi:MAG: glutamate-cysteine ligase family protein, partial [Anaerolineales bacterium]